MRQTFTPQSLIVLDGVIGAIISNGSAFVHTQNGDQIYVPGRQIDAMRVDVGDGVRCWCYHNHPEHAHTAKYRSVRSMATYRLADQMKAPPTAIADALGKALEALPEAEGTEVAPAEPAPSEASFPVVVSKPEPLEGDALVARIIAVMSAPALFSTKDIHAAICKADVAQWGDQKLLTRITNTMVTLANQGEVATVKVYRDTEQYSATAVLYARSVELAMQIMKGETA